MQRVMEAKKAEANCFSRPLVLNRKPCVKNKNKQLFMHASWRDLNCLIQILCIFHRVIPRAVLRMLQQAYSWAKRFGGQRPDAFSGGDAVPEAVKGQ